MQIEDINRLRHEQQGSYIQQQLQHEQTQLKEECIYMLNKLFISRENIKLLCSVIKMLKHE